MSPGWQFRISHTFSKVENLIAFTFPFFNMDTFYIVIPILSDNSVTLIFLFASITSRFTMIAIIQHLKSLDRYPALFH